MHIHTDAFTHIYTHKHILQWVARMVVRRRFGAMASTYTCIRIHISIVQYNPVDKGWGGVERDNCVRGNVLRMWRLTKATGLGKRLWMSEREGG